MSEQRSLRMSRFLRRTLLGAAAAFLASLLVAAIGQTRSPGLLLSITHNSGLPVSVLTEQIRSQARYFSEGTAGH